MANGKIKADTLEHSTAGALDTQYVVNGSAKAWANIDASATLNDSLNISSAEDTSLVYKTMSLTNNFSNEYYATSSQSASATGLYTNTPVHGTLLTTSTYRTTSFNVSNGAAIETTKNVSIAFGDLA